MWNRVRTPLLVTVVALLIWVFAEAESLRSVAINAQVRFESSVGSEWVVDVVDDESGVVSAELLAEGTAASLAVVERLLRAPLVVSPGMEGVPQRIGEHLIDLRGVLMAHADIREVKGFSIKQAAPERARVRVDQLITRDVAVQLGALPGEVDGPPDLLTSTVRVRLPAGEASKLTDASVVLARIDEATWNGLTPGRKETLTGVRLELPTEVAGSAHAILSPRSAEVTLTVRSRTSSAKIASVPVHVRLAPGEIGKWDIEIPEQDRFLTEVTVTGPSDQVKQVQGAVIPLIAWVPLSFEELERGITSKEAVFSELPSTLRFEVANRTVRLKISARKAGNGNGDAGARQ